MRIALLGSGMMGAALGRRWAAKGHDVAYSSRHPEALAELAASTPRAKAMTFAEAAAYAEVAFLGVPYHATRALGEQLGPLLRGKVLLDAGNLISQRDGEEARAAAERGGSGSYTQEAFRGARVVKAFNTVYFKVLADGRTPTGETVGVPLAGDDEEALAVAEQLVRDAGAEPVRIGALSEGARIDFGSKVWNSNLSAEGVRKALELG